MHMNWPPLLTALTLSTLALCSVRSAESNYPAGVEVKNYAGWTNAIHLANGEVLAVAVPGAGGRLLRYQLHGENVLYYDPTLAGKTFGDLNGRGAHGGHQIDIGPELRGMPKRDALWWGEYAWHIPGPYSARLTSKPDPDAGVQISKEFVLDPDNGDLGVTQTIKNTSGATVKYCLWDRTLCVNDGFAIIPLNRGSRFPNKWALRVKDAEGKWLYDGNAKAPREVKVIKNDPRGVWVTGLPEIATVITVGQEMVVAGESVEVTFEAPEAPDTAVLREATATAPVAPVRDPVERATVEPATLGTATGVQAQRGT